MAHRYAERSIHACLRDEQVHIHWRSAAGWWLLVAAVTTAAALPVVLLAQVGSRVARVGRPEGAFDVLEDQFRLLIENAAHITAIVESNGVIRYVSPAVERMLGYAPDHLKGLPLADLLHPDDVAAVLEALRTGIEHPGRGQLIQFRTQHRDGSWRDLETIATNRLDDPVIHGMVLDARDVTERTWSAERLRLSIEALLAIHDVGRLLGSNLEQHAIATALLDGARRIAAIQAAVVLLRTSRGTLRRLQTVGSPPLWESAARSRPVRAARQAAMSSSTPQFFRTTSSRDGSPPFEGCALPLRVSERVIGILEVYGQGAAESWPIGELGTLADQAASAVDRTRLYQTLSERERRLERLVRRLFLAQEEERRRVAFEIHDGLAQLAAAAQQQLEAFAARYHSRSQEREEELHLALDLAARTVREARHLISGLRPTVLDDFGLAPAISYEVQSLRADGWQVDYTDKLGCLRLDAMVETALFRVLQEALANIRKHAHSRRVAVMLERRGRSVRMEIRDWGSGFRPATARGRAGPSERVGLASMQERIALLRGRCTIQSRPGAGARINVEIPIRESRGSV